MRYFHEAHEMNAWSGSVARPSVRHYIPLAIRYKDSNVVLYG
jgi:hypothetical protein